MWVTQVILKIDYFYTIHQGELNLPKVEKWTLIYKRCYKTKSLAMKEEYLLKKDRIKRKMIKKKFTDKLNYEYKI